MKISPEALQKFVAAAQTRATMSAIGEAADIKVSAVFNWLARSKLAEAAGDKDSIFWMSFEPFGFDWMHRHFVRCKNFFDLCVDGFAMELVSGQATELCYGPQDGLPIQERNPLYRYRSDEWLAENGIDPLEKYLWIRDPLTDDIIAPLYQRRQVKPSSHLLIRALAAKLPSSWSEHTTSDVNIRQQVVHQTLPPKFVSRHAPQGDAAVEDGKFTELLPERQDIQELRKAAAKLLANPDRPTSTPTAPVNTGVPPASGELKPTSQYEGGERPPSTPQPRQEPPSYARKTTVDAARTNPRGGNLDRVVR